MTLWELPPDHVSAEQQWSNSESTERHEHQPAWCSWCSPVTHWYADDPEDQECHHSADRKRYCKVFLLHQLWSASVSPQEAQHRQTTSATILCFSLWKVTMKHDVRFKETTTTKRQSRNFAAVIFRLLRAVWCSRCEASCGPNRDSEGRYNKSITAGHFLSSYAGTSVSPQFQSNVHS